MIITSVPAGELVRIFRDAKYLDFKYCAFIVARQIDNREIFIELFKNYSSLASVTGKKLLVVLFYNSNDCLSTIYEAKEELSKQVPNALMPVYYHNCDLIRLELLESMAMYENKLSGNTDTLPSYARGIIESKPFNRTSQKTYSISFELEKYLRSMTEQTEALKQAFQLSESDIPCLIIWDKELDETAALHFTEGINILHIYKAFREIIVRTIEPEVLRKPIEEKILSKEHILTLFNPTKPKNKKKAERLESELRELRNALKKIQPPELLSDVLLDIDKNRQRQKIIKKISLHLPSLKEVITKLLTIMT